MTRYIVRDIVRIALLAIGLAAVSACGAKSTQDLVNEYIAFYYR